MRNKAREYKRTTLRRLDTLSGNQCSAPDCTKSLIAKDDKTIISKICHIEAASCNGPRFNPDMTDEDRRHYNNLILLCDECHKVIDNPQSEKDYPVELLKEWKREHELKQQLTKLGSKTSLLSLAIDAIANISLEEDSQKVQSLIFNVEDKINHNCIIKNKCLIDDYKIFYTKIASLYDELEKQGSFKKENLLRNIRKIYLRIKGKYVGNAKNPIKVIQRNADNIIEDIEEELASLIEKSRVSYLSEDTSFGVSVIMVDAFMRCKILEAPSL